MRDRDRYLLQRGNRYYYYRHVPYDVRAFDSRRFVRVALKTDDKAAARKKRDRLEEADDLYWSSVSTGNGKGARERYKSAVQRAVANGFKYLPMGELIEQAPLPQLLDRIDAIPSAKDTATAEALLGGVEEPKVSLRESFDVYLNEIAASETSGKSEAQFKSWKKVKLRAINNFIEVVGDIPLADITREDARKFYKWWLNRIVPPEGSEEKPLSASAGNRDVGNMRKLYTEYFKHIGDDDRTNPFRNLSFSEKQMSGRVAFSVDWIVKKILDPSMLRGLNIEARLIMYALIETGARPSEIANLQPEQIRLDHKVPHIAIKPVEGREIKTQFSVREIPLVGVSLAALRRAQHGFPRYHDKETTLSATLNKAFRAEKLFPTPEHYIYSFRHSFEKRMTEAGIDFGLRCLLMGHNTNRPAYGDGGSLEYRRNELNKIVLPFDEAIFDDVV